MSSKAEYTSNEAILMMYKCAAKDFRLIADHCENHNYPAEEIIKFLRELADEQEAQAIVVDLRDKL